MRKRTILIFLMPEQGAFNASFVLADNLRKDGYEIIYVHGSDHFDEHIQEQGFRCKTFSFSKNRMPNDIDTWVDDIDSFEDWIDETFPALVLLDPITTIWNYPFIRLFFKKNIKIMNLNTTLSYVSNCKAPPVFSCRIPSDRENFPPNVVNYCLWLKTRFGYYIRRLKPRLLHRSI